MSMRTFIVVLLLAPLTQAMVAPPTAMAFAGEKIKAPVTDDSVRDQVMLRLAGDSEVKGGGVDVSVKDGAVTALRLEGPGPSVEHRCAGDLIQEIKATGFDISR